jgi:Meiotically Up-regulated Gene 113 (MUG113) protein
MIRGAFVYLAFNEDTGLIKIGFSSANRFNIRSRERGLRSAFQAAIRIVFAVYSPDARQLERHLHWYFRDKARGREWFRLSQEDCWNVRGMMTLDRLDGLRIRHVAVDDLDSIKIPKPVVMDCIPP